jgi:hypothetical protein
MKVYPASKARHADWWKALQAAGVPLAASWIDSDINRTDDPSDDAWSRHWSACIQESSSADVVLFYAAEGEQQCGSLVELGAALASGKRVFVVSCYGWSVAHHPRCRIFPSLAAAVEAIMAGDQGERLRAAE